MITDALNIKCLPDNDIDPAAKLVSKCNVLFEFGEKIMADDEPELCNN
jgi:hypothetical protein